jgi:hypothetical protein
MPGTAAGVRKGWKTRKGQAPPKVQAIVMNHAQLVRLNKRAAAFAERQAERSGFISGLEINLGKIEEEDNPSFRDLGTLLSMLQRMGNDAQIAAQLRANILPLFSAVQWRTEGGNQEMRDLIDQNILRKGDPRFWCETPWLQRLLEKLMCLHYGFSLHGKVWDVVDGYRIYRSLTYLHPKSLGGPHGPWEWSEDGTRLVAIHRRFRRPDQSQEPDERRLIDDIDACVWWQTGENWQGQSLIRPMVRSWVNKDLASKIGMIALMNGGVGIPMATGAPGQGVKQLGTLATMAKDLRGGDKSRNFIVLENGQKIELMTSNGNLVDASPVIAEQNMDIAAAGATNFMQSNQTQSGSRAGGSVMMVSYMQQLEAVKVWLQEQINHGAGYLPGLVEELITENFSPGQITKDGCPMIVGSRVSATEQLDNVPNIVTAVQQGALVADLTVDTYIRKALMPGSEPLTPAEFDKAKAQGGPLNLGGRPSSPTPLDQNNPRADKMGRQYGLQATAQKKTSGASLPRKSPASWHWLTSTAG